jgi:hypothetical protein
LAEAYTPASMLQVAVELPATADSAGEWLADAQAMDGAGAAALLLPLDAADRQVLLGVLAATTSRSMIDARGAGEAVRWLARGRLLEDVEGWLRVPEPQGRDHWRQLHAEAEAAGAAGVLVAMSPRLLDLLRNPDAEEDRSDLRLAQG